MLDVLVPLVNALIWATVVLKVRDLRRSPDNLALRSLWLSYLMLAVALTIFQPQVYVAINHAAGVPNLAEVLARSLVLIAGCAAQSMLLYLTHSRPSADVHLRHRIRILVPALVAMGLLFALAPVDQETQRFTSTYAGDPYVTGYLAVFLCYLAFALIDVIRLCWRYAPLADRELLGMGLRIVATGCGLGLAYIAHKGIYLGIRAAGGSASTEAEATVARLLALAGLTLIIVGTTLPAWGPRLRPLALHRWFRAYIAHQRLYPLWSALYRSTPEIALDPPRSRLRDALDVRDIDFRLYRRVIEIRDGRLALRPYLCPDVRAGVAPELASSRLDAVDELAAVEARAVTEALRAKREGRPGQAGVRPDAPTGSADLYGEVAWREKVARSFAEETARRPTRRGAKEWKPASSVRS